jgi:hypothetical protein
MNTIAPSNKNAFFVHDPETKTGLRAIRHDHAAHPCQHRFAEEFSARNYARELQAPTMAIPVMVVTAVNLAQSVALVRAVIALRHHAKAPVMHAPADSRSLAERIAEAESKELPFLWIATDSLTAKCISIQAAHGKMRLYFTTPPNPASTRDIDRHARLINLKP